MLRRAILNIWIFVGLSARNSEVNTLEVLPNHFCFESIPLFAVLF